MLGLFGVGMMRCGVGAYFRRCIWARIRCRCRFTPWFFIRRKVATRRRRPECSDEVLCPRRHRPGLLLCGGPSMLYAPPQLEIVAVRWQRIAGMSSVKDDLIFGLVFVISGLRSSSSVVPFQYVVPDVPRRASTW